LVGESLSGKSTLAKVLAASHGYTILDMKAVEDDVKSKMTDEEGNPFEGQVPQAEVEKEIVARINAAKDRGDKTKFVFDGFTHKKAEDFLKLIGQFGLPEFVLCLTADEKVIKKRYKAKNEVDEVSEEQQEALSEETKAAKKIRLEIMNHFAPNKAKVQLVKIDTDRSIESVSKELSDKFSPKVLLVNHEKVLNVDTACANLAIKHNALYISAYQIIKQHIEDDTEWGKRLNANKQPKAVAEALAAAKDDFMEATYSPLHFDLGTVLQLLKETVALQRSNQKFILLEGLCNSSKMSDVDEALALRNMDEFFAIEKVLGDVAGVISLTFVAEPDAVADVQYEKFKEAPKVK